MSAPSIHAEPEILAPRRRSTLSDEALDQIANVLDECFRIPGTRVRIGLDAIVGIIPGIGDLIGGVLSLVFVVAGLMRGLPKAAILRMVVNIGLDVVIGAVPFLGDGFIAWFKVNRRNYNVLMRYSRGAIDARSEAKRDFMFVLGVLFTGLMLMLAPVLVIFGLWFAFHR